MNIRKMLNREQASNQEQQPKDNAASVDVGDLNFTAIALHLANLNRFIEKDEITEADLRGMGESLIAINAHVQVLIAKMNEAQSMLTNFFEDLEKRASRWPKYEKQIQRIVANFKQGMSKHQKQS